MVIEYAGELIRSTLTDKREKYYDGKGIGCYMFKIDENLVVDATMRGNAARFINHACEVSFCYFILVLGCRTKKSNFGEIYSREKHFTSCRFKPQFPIHSFCVFCYSSYLFTVFHYTSTSLGHYHTKATGACVMRNQSSDCMKNERNNDF